MNATQLKGQLKRVRGEAKRQWGRITGSRTTRMSGTMQKLSGRVQVKYGRIKEAVGL